MQPLSADECRFFYLKRLVTEYIPPVLRQLFVLRWNERHPDDKWDIDGARREACGKKLLKGVEDMIPVPSCTFKVTKVRKEKATITIEQDSDPPINLYRYAKKGVAVVVVQEDDSSVLSPDSTVDAIEPDEHGVHGRQLVVVAPSVPNPLPQKCGGLRLLTPRVLPPANVNDVKNDDAQKKILKLGLVCWDVSICFWALTDAGRRLVDSPTPEYRLKPEDQSLYEALKAVKDIRNQKYGHSDGCVDEPSWTEVEKEVLKLCEVLNGEFAKMLPEQAEDGSALAKLRTLVTRDHADAMYHIKFYEQSALEQQHVLDLVMREAAADLERQMQQSTPAGSGSEETTLQDVMAVREELMEANTVHELASRVGCQVGALTAKINQANQYLWDGVNTLLQGQASLLEGQRLQEDRLQQIQQQNMQMLQMLASLQMHGVLSLTAQPAASSSTHVDFLFVVCSPKVSPLPQASIEAHVNAKCVELAGLSALVHSNGNLTELNTIILHRQPRVIVFAGHADASHPSSERTLGLTDASGNLIVMEPDTIARIFAQPSERLELVSLNGCCSSELCEAITRRYSLPTCGWSSRTADAAAKAHSLGLVDALVQRMNARPAAGRLTSGDLHAAFQHAERSVLAAVARSGTSKWALIDPNSCVAGKTPDGKWAAGVPVLLNHPRFPTLANGESLPPLPSEVRGHSAFTGRRVELDALFDTFFPIQRTLANAPMQAARAVRQAVLQAIRGMGGVGKTELAVQYAVRYHHLYPLGVYFVSVDCAATEESLVRRMATSIGLPLDVDRAAVHRWFAMHEGWLLICDNADDVDAIGRSGALTRTLPPLNAPGHVLLTSRIGTEDFGPLGIASPLTLGLLELSAAERLLLSVATGLDEVAATEQLATLDSAERAAVAWLVGDEGLARLPLAILQAGSAIREDKYSFADYRLAFERRRVALLANAPAGTQREEQSVLTTWNISIEALQRKSPAAAEWLALCAPLAPDDIPIEIFLDVDRIEDEGEGWRALRAKLQGAADDDERRDVIQQQVRAARKYSLIEWDSAKATVSMHRLVKEVQWRQLGVAGTQRRTVELLGRLLEAAIPKLDKTSPLSEANRAGRTLPHVAALLKSAARIAPTGLLPVALLNAARSAHDRRGEWAAQVMMAEAALREVRAARGEEHPDTLGSMNSLAIALDSVAQYAEAAEMHRTTLEARRRVLGEEHPDTLTSMNGLAIALSNVGQHAEAVEMHRTTLEARRRVLGEEHPHTLDSMNNLANAQNRAGQHDEAAEMHRRALEAMRRVLGEEHPRTLSSMNNLADALSSAGRHDEAVKMFRTTLEVKQRLRGNEHPDTLGSMTLANARNSADQHDEASEMHRRALEVMRRVLGEEHPHTLGSMNALANALNSAGQHDDAAEMHRRALEAMRRVLGEEHPHTLSLMNNLANALSSAGRHDEAVKMLRTTLELKQRLRGKEHPDTLTSMNALACALERAGQHAEAVKMHRTTLEAMRRVLGEEHPRTLSSMNNLANALSSAGQHAEAVKMFRTTLELKQRLRGKEHPDTLTSMNALACALERAGQHPDAVEMRRTTLEAMRRVLGEEHPRTLSSMNNLANALSSAGQHAEAVKMFRTTLELKQRLRGNEHPDTLTSMNALAIALNSAGQHADAVEMRRTTLEARRRVLGEEHPRTLDSMNSLAIALGRAGQYAEAAEMFRTTLEASRRVLGEEHPETLDSMDRLAIALSRAGQHVEAAEMFRTALEARRRVQGAEHPDTLSSMNRLNRLAIALSRAGRHAEAVEMHRTTLEARRRVQGEEHPDTLGSKHDLAIALDSLVQHAEAAEMHLTAVYNY